jgi:hypothetical protein
MIMAKNDRNSEDGDIAPGDMKLQWSELIHQMFKDVRGPKKTDNIRFAFRDAISNEATTDLITSLRIEHGVPSSNENMVTFDLNSKDAAEVTRANTLIGTRNGMGVAYLLQDYPDTFGRKTISKVHTFRFERAGDTGAVRFALAFELAPV